VLHLYKEPTGWVAALYRGQPFQRDDNRHAVRLRRDRSRRRAGCVESVPEHAEHQQLQAAPGRSRDHVAGAALARQIIKRVTGGDTVSARFMYREWFEFVPVFKVWLVTNHLPSVPYADAATWRRIRVLPFRRTFSKREQDPRLREKLREELPGILAWAVSGAREWYRQGLGSPPVAIVDALDGYRLQQDTTGRFLEEETSRTSDARAYKSDLYKAYRDWCESEGLAANSSRAFHDALRARGCVERKDGSGNRYFVGLKLRD
jgi:putative DNA primase/helicase